MAIDLITSYQALVDEKFTQESKLSLVTNQNYSWSGAKTIKLYRVGTTGMNDYARNSGMSRYGVANDLSAGTQELILKKDRSFTFIIDKMDEEETGGALAAGTALERQLREVAIPEVDSYTYGVMCDNAGIKPEAVELTADNIYEHIITATKCLDDALAPEEGRALIVTPDVYYLMKKNKDIIMQVETGAEMRMKGVIATLDGCNVIKMAAARLPKNFGFMMCHSVATTAPLKLADYVMHDNPPGISGYLVEGRLYYDAFVLENKKKAIYYQAVKAAEEVKDK